MNSDMAEMLHYFNISSRETVETAYALYEDNYAAQHSAAECTYIYQHRELPRWALYVESFEYVPATDAFVITHSGELAS